MLIEGGYSCRPVFNRRGVLIEGGVQVGQFYNKMSANFNSKGELIEGVDVDKSFDLKALELVGW